MLSIDVSTWNATKNVMQSAIVEREDNINKFVNSAIKPPTVCINAIKNAVFGPLNS